MIPAPLVRFFASPYVAGDSLQKAMDVAVSLLARRRLLTTLDLLAEGITNQATVRQNIDTYLRMVDVAAGDPRFSDPATKPTLSLKLSSYTTEPMDHGGSGKGSREGVLEIAERARAKGVRLTLDMESRHWTDFTLETLRLLHGKGHTHVGCVIQSRLHRSEKDLDLLPPKIRTRVVIGIYREPADVALVAKPEMKERLLYLAERLLQRGHFVEFATHDETYVRRFVDGIVPKVGARPEQFEVQMLYGVPRERLLQELVSRGIRARLYVPFALGWGMAIAYLRRRLDEYPAMMFLVAKNTLLRG